MQWKFFQNNGYLKYLPINSSNKYVLSFIRGFIKMTSIAPSDSESNVSGFIRYSGKDIKYLYTSMVEGMEIINQDILQIENNFKNLIKLSGPLESQLSAVLQSLPKPHINLPMETE